MKNLFLIMAFIFLALGTSHAQDVISSSSKGSGWNDAGNEVKMNFMNLIVLGSLEIGYENFLSENHSLDFQIHINDRFGFNSQKNGKEYKTNSVQASMNFYLGDNERGRFYIYPLAKIRFGDFEESVDTDVVSTNMNAFMFGAGAGYKWELSENFAFGPYASIVRGFSDEVADRFSRIEINGGFSLGYRF